MRFTEVHGRAPHSLVASGQFWAAPGLAAPQNLGCSGCGWRLRLRGLHLVLETSLQEFSTQANNEEYLISAPPDAADYDSLSSRRALCCD
jgi:hypothetical protein